MYRFFLIVALTSPLGVGTLRSQAVVEGKVLDFDSEPARNSSVEAFPVREGGFAGNLMWTRVDDKGNFRLTLPEGRYEIRAKDESEGYPDPNSLLSVDPSAIFPELTVSKGNISGLQVKLGPKGGILDGEIRDSNSRLPISGAKVTIRDAHNPSAYVEVFSNADGHYQFTVPGKPVSVSASASGYKSSQAAEVLLSGGDHRSLDISLEK